MTRNDDTPSLHPLTVFSFLWGWVMLFHMLPRAILLTNPFSVALTGAALLVIWRPASNRLLLLLAALHIVEVAVYLPDIGNHWWQAALLSVVIAATGAWQWAQHRAIDRDRWWQTIAIAGRWLLLILYFFAFFHKLNVDFFNPAVSCAVTRYDVLAQIYPLPQGAFVDTSNIYLTLLVEGGIPVLLLFRRTRYWGILLALGFHGVLGLDRFYPFGSVIYALLCCFLPADFMRHARLRHRALWRIRTTIHKVFLSAALITTVIIMRFYLGFDVLPQILAIPFWIPYAAVIFYLTVTTMPRTRPQQSASQLLATRQPFVIGVVLVAFINGWLPYTGLKTQYSLEMYSNLRTEAGVSNHFLIPADWQVWEYTYDQVQILSTDAELFDKFVGDTEQPVIPRIEFDRRMWHSPPETTARVRYNGEEQVLHGGDTLAPISWQTKLLAFDAIEQGEQNPCTH